MGMDSGCRTCVSEVEKGLYQCNNSRRFQPGKDDYSVDRCRRVRYSLHSQTVSRFVNSQTSQHLLWKMHRWRTELRHVRSGPLLAIMETMKQWHHYLEGANHKVLIQCNHSDLEYFQIPKVVSRRQARWAEMLSSYYFIIKHLEGKENPVDGPSRRPDYEIGYENMMPKLLVTFAPATLAATTITKSYDDLLSEITAAQETDF